MTAEIKFGLYENLLREWNDKMNLVAPSTLENIRERHIDDSAQLADYIPKTKTIIDLGSGAGFPAVVLAILGYKVIAVESIGKKCQFLETVKQTLDLQDFEIVNDRIENILPDIIKHNNGQYIFTARAFAPLTRILDWTARAKIPYILLKGQGIQDEIDLAKQKYKFKAELFPSATGPGFITKINL
jgi:16S rRNA (guanine527-N7)-methyltransferase